MSNERQSATANIGVSPSVQMVNGFPHEMPRWHQGGTSNDMHITGVTVG